MDIPPNVPQMGMPFRGNFPGQLPPSNQPPMMNMGNMGNMGMRIPSSMINQGTLLSEQEEKKKQFARAVYVSGFQRTLTKEMIHKHFETIKPVIGIKLPLSKLGQNKGFAFIYFASEDDASLVKKQLDRSVILRDKIRVTKTVVAQNLSKMMFKLKCRDLDNKAIESIEKTYFNDQSLEREVERIISPFFGKTVQVNKIIVPTSKKDKTPLKYARVFFYISNLKEAVAIARRSMAETGLIERPDKNQYEVILGHIAELLNKEDKFSRIATAEIYEYTKKNQSNVLHIKGLKLNKGQNLNALADQLKQFIQSQNMQWQIINSYVAQIQGKGVWANITFQTYEDTVKAYEHLKLTRPKFRDLPLYGSLRNVKDLRTVVFSVVKKDTDEKTVYKFLRELADNSKVIPAQGDAQPYKKYDFFSFNIIEQKTFFIDNEGIQVGATEGQKKEKILQSWRENNTVPRRLVVHFFNDMEENDIKELLNDIKLRVEYKDVFIEDSKVHPLRANHQKGHIKDNFYIKHTDLNKKRGKRQNQRGERPQRNNTRGPRQDNNNQMRRGHQGGQGQGPTQPKFDYTSFAPKGGIPKFTPGMGTGNFNVRPQMPPMGGTKVPMMGNMPPMMGTKPPGMMGQPPMMGNQPPMMGNQPPMMGNQPPMMGSQVPMMGKPPMMGMTPPPMGMMSKPLNMPPSNSNVPPKQ